MGNIVDEFKVPKYSYAPGWTDEGISDALDKPPGFRYSDKFLREWYSEKEYTNDEHSSGIMWAFVLSCLFWVIVFLIWMWLK